jgi:hypothetical protein
MAEHSSSSARDGNGHRQGLNLGDIINERKTLVVSYGAARFEVVYRPHVASNRKFLRRMDLAGMGRKLDDEGRDIPATGDEVDDIILDGMLEVLESWDVNGPDDQPWPLHRDSLTDPAMRQDLLDVIWFAIKDDSEVGKAARRSAERWRSVVS